MVWVGGVMALLLAEDGSGIGGSLWQCGSRRRLWLYYTAGVGFVQDQLYNAICIVWAKEEVPETSLSPWVVAVI